MKATQTTLQPIIEGAKQYVVPSFQRLYLWKKPQWEQFWDDLIELTEMDRPRSHFLGSIVTMQTVSVPEGVPKYLLIDGQQRLTTLFILLALIRDHAAGVGDLADEINNTLLVNPYQKGTDHYKLLPTQADRDAFKAIIDGTRPLPGSRIALAYEYFARKLQGSAADVQALKRVVTSCLSMVSIVLDADDNPYLVFESLNAKGLPLTQSDLIRNFFFMRIHTDLHDEIHGDYWSPMESQLGEDLTEFIRHYLMKDGEIVRQNDVYIVLKDRVGQGESLGRLKELAGYAAHYGKLLNPNRESDPDIRLALDRIGRLEMRTVFPFLLNCYHEFSAGRLGRSDFASILQTLDNYLLRRFVCGVPTNQLNKIFAPLFSQASASGESGLAEGVKRVLQSKGYPRDAEFKAKLIDAKLYGGDRGRKGKLILDRLESHSGHKEQVDLDAATIEHVMPQTLTEEWQSHIGDGWEITHELWLHSLGNLTLTGYNTPLSNEPFGAKKAIFEKSHIGLNKYFKDVVSWDREAIEARAAYLADVALAVWPYFGIENPSPEGGTTSRLSPKSLKIFGETYSVDSWRDVIEQTLNAVARLEPEGFQRAVKLFPRSIRVENSGMHSYRQLTNEMFVNVNLSARDSVRFCTRFLDAVEVSAEDWEVETA